MNTPDDDKSYTSWLEKIIRILENKKETINKEIKGKVKAGDVTFIGLKIDGKSLDEYELFRRYLLFVRTRTGIEDGAKLFKNKKYSDVIIQFEGQCPICLKNKPLLNQWSGPAELSFYQRGDIVNSCG